jgi:hypothetical protein
MYSSHVRRRCLRWSCKSRAFRPVSILFTTVVLLVGSYAAPSACPHNDRDPLLPQLAFAALRFCPLFAALRFCPLFAACGFAHYSRLAVLPTVAPARVCGRFYCTIGNLRQGHWQPRVAGAFIAPAGCPMPIYIKMSYTPQRTRNGWHNKQVAGAFIAPAGCQYPCRCSGGYAYIYQDELLLIATTSANRVTCTLPMPLPMLW